MQNGLYKVAFSSPLGQGSGVVVLNGTEFFGGDAGIAYAGTITGNGNQYEVQLRTRRHTQTGAGSVLGSDNVTVTLHGEAQSDSQITLSAAVPGVPGGFQAALTKLDL